MRIGSPGVISSRVPHHPAYGFDRVIAPIDAPAIGSMSHETGARLPAVQLENLAGCMRQVLMQKPDESCNFMTGVETTQGVGCEDPCPAAFCYGCGHPGCEKSRENRIDADVGRAAPGRQVNNKT